MKKIYHLSTCKTCQRIIAELDLDDDVVLQDVKADHLDEKTVDHLSKLAGSYEAIFSRRAQLYRKDGHHERDLSEEDYKALILSHYTYLKRPVIVVDNQIFVGNSKKVVAAAKEVLG